MRGAVLALLLLGCIERATGPDDLNDVVWTTSTVRPEVEVRVVESAHKWLRKANYGWLSSWRAKVISTGRIHCMIEFQYIDDEGFLLQRGVEPASLWPGENVVLGQELVPEETARRVVAFRARTQACR